MILTSEKLHELFQLEQSPLIYPKTCFSTSHLKESENKPII